MEVKSTPKIQWVPEKHIDMRILTPEKELNGYGETALSGVKPGVIVQLERFGFVRIEKRGKKNVIAVFCHS